VYTGHRIYAIPVLYISHSTEEHVCIVGFVVEKGISERHVRGRLGNVEQYITLLVTTTPLLALSDSGKIGGMWKYACLCWVERFVGQCADSYGCCYWYRRGNRGTESAGKRFGKVGIDLTLKKVGRLDESGLSHYESLTNLESVIEF
jgi:hypothetical protein